MAIGDIQDENEQIVEAMILSHNPASDYNLPMTKKAMYDGGFKNHEVQWIEAVSLIW